MSRRRYAGPPRQDGIVWKKLFSAGVSDAEFDRVVERQVRVCLKDLRQQLEDDAALALTPEQRTQMLATAEALIRPHVRKELEKGRKSLLQ